MSRLTCADLRTLFRETPTAVVLVDVDGRIRTVNRQAAELFGYEPEELEDEEAEVLVPDGLEAVHREHRERYMDDPAPRPMGANLALEGLHRDGSRIPLEISLTPVELEDGFRVMAAIRDVSELREVRAWGIEAMQAAEEERLRIARELHDDLAQRLATLQLHAQVALQTDGDQQERVVGRLQDEIRAASELVRQVIHGLRPPALTELGLSRALRREAQRLLEDRRIDGELEIEATDGRPGAEIQLAIYRVAQEALGNAVEHADASRVAIRLRLDGDWIELDVRDDGRGFDPERVARNGDRFGLIGMRERAGAVGGRLELESAPGEGTRVRMRVPMD